MTGHQYNVLFPRVRNLARSQMGKAHIGVLSKARIQSYSAGGLMPQHRPVLALPLDKLDNLPYEQ